MVTESWEAAYEKIRRRFVCAVGGWVEDVARDLDAIEAAPETCGGLECLFRKLHDLAGSSGTYGLPVVSTLASDAVLVSRRALERDAVLTTAEIQRVRELLQAIRSEMQANPETSRRDGSTGGGDDDTNGGLGT